MKKIVSFIIFAVMFTVLAVAQGSTPWDGTVPASFTATGAGTKESPYLITEASQLAYIAKQIDGTNEKLYQGVHFRLENDLDLGGMLQTPSNWLPIGSKNARNFHGIFDGNNKSIHNIYINTPAGTMSGFFGQNSIQAVVKNLTIASGSINSKQNLGGVVAVNQGVIENCVNLVDITASGTYAGGITGHNYGHIKSCYNTGKVTGTSWIGGIAGKLSKSSNYIGMIEFCFNIGKVHSVNGASAKVGGLIGEMSGTPILTNSYNTGDISYINGNNLAKIGGLVGDASGGIISSCYNVGGTPTATIGGLIGNKTVGATITNCYYDKQMCATSKSIGNVDDTDDVKGLLTKDMVKVSGVTGFNSDSWLFTADMYPCLKAFETNKTANLYAVPIILSSTSETKYDTRYAVKSNFTVSTALSSTWSVLQGTSVVLNQSTATVTRPEIGDDNVTLKVVTNGISRDIEIVVYQKPVTVTIVQPTTGGTIKVMDGETELVSPAAVESNTILTLIATPGDEYMLDVFTVNGGDIEGDKVTITGNTSISAKFNLIAPPGTWDGSIATEFGGGSGKDIAPYLIKSADQLAYLAQQVNSGANNYEGAYFKLVYNLDMGGNSNNWIPIGKRNGDLDNTSFMGYFDGNNKEISNLHIDATDINDVGLFGHAGINSEIKNLGLASDCDVKSMVTNPEMLQYTGGIIGSTMGALKNCWNKGNVSGTGVVGGLVGYGNNIAGCYNAGNVTNTMGPVGGIAGITMVSTITDCYNSGKIVGNQTTGGIIGSGNSSFFMDCYNVGDIFSIDGPVGGIAGTIGGSVRVSAIEACVNFGPVSVGKDMVGGMVGKVSSGRIANSYNAGVISGKSQVGGVIGRYNGMQGAISGCYNIGAVNGTVNDPFVGGVLGYFDSGIFINNYFDKQIVPLERSIGNAQNTGNDKKVLTSFLITGAAIEGFDARCWTFTEGLYPQLTRFKDLECSKLNASPATLYAVNETNYETVKTVRTDFTVSTTNAVVWSVEAGTTVAISGTTATVTPKVDADEQVTIKATLGNLSKSITINIPKLAYKLMIDPSTNGSLVVKNAADEELSSGSELAPGTVITLTPTAEEGYHFVKWWDDNTENPRTITINSNYTVSAIFEINSYTLTAAAGANGEITPEGVTKVKFGANQTYTIMPNVGYTTETLLVDGTSIAVANNYTFNHISANHTISATFKIKSYTITATAGENGTITPNGATTVDHGTNKTYTIAANAGYQIAKLTVDGATVPVAATYTFNSVVTDHTIEVTFEKQLFVITASSNEFGAISPSGKVEVVIGEDKEFFIIPNDGYSIKDVLVDDISVLKDVANSRYTFKAVNSNHTIHVIFSDGVGVSTLEDSQISIWSNRATVYLRSDYNNELNAEVIDVTGKLVSQTSFTTQTEIQVNNKGLYIIRVADGDVIKSVKKVIIN